MKDQLTGPAFPTQSETLGHNPGMTYRQWLIGQALAGTCANVGACSWSNAKIAEIAVEVADAALAKMGTQS